MQEFVVNMELHSLHVEITQPWLKWKEKHSLLLGDRLPEFWQFWGI